MTSVRDDGRKLFTHWAWLQDASWRHASEFLDALETSSKFVSIRAAWTAHDAAVKIITGMAGSVVPWRVVGHRAFDAKESPIMIGDDEKKR